jgi:hypothetical protein
MPTVSVDLAYKSYDDVGIVTLEKTGSRIEVRPIRLAQRGLRGLPTVQALSDALVDVADQIGAAHIFIDGPQGWKAPDNGLEHARLCEHDLATPGKTGLPGACKPGNYLDFISFAVQLFDALHLRGWTRLTIADVPPPNQKHAVESFPTSAWRSLGIVPLPGKTATRSEMLLERVNGLRRVFHLDVPDQLSHDELQALVSGLAGIAFEAGNMGGVKISGSPPIQLGGAWREGFIVNPTRKAAGESDSGRPSNATVIMSERSIEGLSHRFPGALVGAARLHATQKRKGTDIPYIAHLLGVTGIALEFGATEDEAIAAVLHDVIEDAPSSLGSDWVRRWIRFEFGEVVLAIVEGCTDADSQPKPQWLQRKVNYIDHLASASKSVVLVSASDKLHNARAILRDYRQLGDELWARFNRDAGKVGTVSYYRGLVQAFRETGYHGELVGELDVVVTEIETVTRVNGVWPMPR